MRNRSAANLALGLVVAVLALVLPSVAPSSAASRTPSAPRSVTAKPGDGQVIVKWRAPRSTAGSRITRYRVVFWAAGSTTKKKIEVRAAVLSTTVSALTNGTTYNFRVYAQNKHGWGVGSKQTSAVPHTIPGPPVGVGATPGYGQMGLTWAAPTDNGGAPVNEYAVRWSENQGTTWVPAVTSSGTDVVTGTSTTVTGLGDGSTKDGPTDFVFRYRFEVRAHNSSGWGPWAPTGYAAGVLQQAPPYVPANSQGDAAAAAFRDLATGSYWSEGYPTPAGAGTWQDNGPLTFTIPPSCGSTPAVACPGGVPQEPPPTISFDLVAQAGDLPRREVANVTGAHRYDLTYRARVTTSEPVSITYQGTDCTFAIDSTAGSTPDLKLTGQIGWAPNPSTAGNWYTGSLSNVALTQLEGADYVIGGATLCILSGSFIPASMLQDQIAGAAADALGQYLGNTCGAVSPWWWQPCYTILDPVSP